MVKSMGFTRRQFWLQRSILTCILFLTGSKFFQLSRPLSPLQGNGNANNVYFSRWLGGLKEKMQVKQSLCLSHSKCSTSKKEREGEKSPYVGCLTSSTETPDTRKPPPSDLLKLSQPTDEEMHFCNWLASDLEATDNLWSLRTGSEVLPYESKLQGAGKIFPGWEM